MKRSEIVALFSDKSAALDLEVRPANHKKEFKNALHQEAPPSTSYLIDLSATNPDAMTDVFVIDALSREAARWENKGSNSEGLPIFKEAAAEYLSTQFDTKKLNRAKDIAVISTMRGVLSLLCQLFINSGSGDIVLVPAPAPSYITQTIQYFGGTPYSLPLKAENNYLPDYSLIPSKILKKAKLLLLNYPNYPTGATATREFYKETLAFAEANHIFVVQDASYAALTFKEEDRLSFLSIVGAKKAGIEIHEMSQSFNMSGWQIGFAAGNGIVLQAMTQLSGLMGESFFMAMQHAALYALKHPEIAYKTATKYHNRLTLLVNALNSIGFHTQVPKASHYLYAQCPKGIEGGEKFESATAFSNYLSCNKQIQTTPWSESGEYISFSVAYLAYGNQEEHLMMEELLSRFSDIKLIF